MMRMSCIVATEEDVIILISHTGRTKAMIDIAVLAQQNDSTVIGITSKDSPLAKECNLVLSMDVPEDTDVYMPMASRIAQMALIDVLATGFTLRRGEKFRENLRKVKQSLKDSRTDKAL
jgi:RpiR family carbohydrate utilization transcriptional regulator